MQQISKQKSFVESVESEKGNPGSYEYMMKKLGQQVEKMSYVRKNPDLERRRGKFFSGYRNEIEANIFQDAMYRIGFFQLPENNLNHIKGVRETTEKSLLHRQR